MSASSTDLTVTVNLGRSVPKVSWLVSLPLLPPCLHYSFSFRHFLLSIHFPVSSSLPSPFLSFKKNFFYDLFFFLFILSAFSGIKVRGKSLHIITVLRRKTRASISWHPIFLARESPVEGGAYLLVKTTLNTYWCAENNAIKSSGVKASMPPDR